MKFSVINLGPKGMVVMESKRHGAWEIFNANLQAEEVQVIRVCLLAWGWREIVQEGKDLFASSSAGYYDAYVKGWLGSRGQH